MTLRRLVVGIVALGLLGGGAYLVFGRADTGSSALKASSNNTTAQPAVKGTDKVVSDSRVVPVRSAELSLPAGGILAETPVAEGNQVSTGQLMARLDARQQQAAVLQAEAALARAKASLARSNAGLAQLKAGPRDEDLAAARAAVRIAEAELARVQKGPDQSQLIAAQANMAKAERALQQAQFVYDQIQNVSDVRSRPEAVKLEQATIDYEAAKAQYEHLKAGPSQADVAVAAARIEQAKASLAQLQAGARPEAIAAGEADVAGAEADVASAEATLNKARVALADTDLRAPFAGTIVSLNFKVGELVSPNSPLVRLADTSSWQIETQDLTELSVVRVRKGDRASVTFDAIPALTLPGVVSQINGFGKNKQGDIVYAVVVKPDRQDDRLRWNMTASVVIEPGEGPAR